MGSNLSPVIVFVALGGIVLLVLHQLYNIRTSSLSKVPGPWVARWSNLWLKLHVLRGQRVHYIHRLHLKYGPIVRISPTEISVSDLEATKTVHRIGAGFLKSPWYLSFNESRYPGIFAMTDPNAHAVRRRLLAQSFSKSNLMKWEPLVQQKVELAVTRIQEEARKKGEADILKWWTFMATDLIGELSFGDSFRMLEQGQKNAYIKDLETTMMFSGIRSELPGLVSLLSLLPIPAIRKIQTLGERVSKHGAESVRRHKHMVLVGELSDKPTFFSKIFAAGKAQTMSDGAIEAEASNLIVAGSDTTAVTLTYLVWAVLRKPPVHQRLLQELQSLGPSFDAAQLEHLPFLNAVIEETLRLYGAAPGSLPRIAPAGGCHLGGFLIPGGTTVSTQAFSLHRTASIFSNPEEFDAVRWLNPTPRMQEAMMPFGAGSRACIGVHLARLEISLAAATFFRSCGGARVSESTTETEMALENYFLVAPRAHECFITLPAA